MDKAELLAIITKALRKHDACCLDDEADLNQVKSTLYADLCKYIDAHKAWGPDYEG